MTKLKEFYEKYKDEVHVFGALAIVAVVIAIILLGAPDYSVNQ